MSDRAYEFTIDGMDSDAFTVLQFTGEESISAPYRFDFQLVTENKNLDFESALSSTCCLKIVQDNLFASRAVGSSQNREDVYIHGIVTSLYIENNVKRSGESDLLLLRVEMSHPMFWMNIDNRNQVYCGKSIPEIVEQELKNAGLRSGEDFKLDISNYRGNMADDRDSKDFPKVSYITQYRESSLNFIDRLLQREGIYYYYTHSQSSNTVHLIDSRESHPDADPNKLRYEPDSPFDRGACVQSFTVGYNRVIKKVLLRDYNFKRPDSFVDAEHDVHNDGVGETCIYAENFSNEGDADNLARLRSELHLCRRQKASGSSTASFLRPGHKFELTGHFMDKVNTGYMLTSITHRGSQAMAVYNQFGYRPDGMVDLDYCNDFCAIPADVQYRPEMTASKTRIHSTIPAHIDHDEVSDTGAYKVKMPFDLSGTEDGKASCWCRFMKQYVGTNFGQHFPLRKGTEVMMGFIDGDPDRPYIAGAMENATHISVTNSKDIGCERLANGNFQAFTTKGEDNLFSAIPEGVLAGYAGKGVRVEGNRVSLGGSAGQAFAGMAEDGGDKNDSSGGKTYTLGQETATSGLMPSTITPKVLVGRVQDQTNIVTADEQTVRSGALYDEQVGARHEDHIGDRYVSNNGTTHLQDTLHVSRTVITNAQTYINSINEGVIDTISCPGTVTPAAGGGSGGSGSSSGSSQAGFTMPDIQQIKRDYYREFKNNSEPFNKFMNDVRPDFSGMAQNDIVDFQIALQDLLEKSLGMDMAGFEDEFDRVVRQYLPGKHAAKFLETFQRHALGLLDNEPMPQDEGAAKDAVGAYFANAFDWVGGGDTDKNTTKVHATAFNPSANLFWCKLTLAICLADLTFTAALAVVKEGLIFIDAKLFGLLAEIKAGAIMSGAMKAYPIDWAIEVLGSKWETKTSPAHFKVSLGGFVDLKAEAAQKVVANENRLVALETSAEASKTNMTAVKSALEATATTILGVCSATQAVNSKISAVATATKATESEACAAKLESKGAQIRDAGVAVSTGLSDIGSQVAKIQT